MERRCTLTGFVHALLASDIVQSIDNSLMRRASNSQSVSKATLPGQEDTHLCHPSDRCFISSLGMLSSPGEFAFLS